MLLNLITDPDFIETPAGRFEALFCATQAQACRQATDMLLKELRTAFLWHETVRDVETFNKLADHVRQELLSTSLKKNVLLSMSDKGEYVNMGVTGADRRN